MGARANMIGSVLVLVVLGSTNIGCLGMALWSIGHGAHEGWLVAWLGHSALARDIAEFWAERFRRHRHLSAVVESKSHEGEVWHG